MDKKICFVFVRRLLLKFFCYIVIIVIEEICFKGEEVERRELLVQKVGNLDCIYISYLLYVEQGKIVGNRVQIFGVKKNYVKVYFLNWEIVKNVFFECFF